MAVTRMREQQVTFSPFLSSSFSSCISLSPTGDVCPKNAIACKARQLLPLPRECTIDEYDLYYYAEYYDYFDFESNCANKTETICIKFNSPSKCDLWPQCEEGEDERGCEDEYRRKGIIDPEETFPCESPSYKFGNWTLSTLWAIPCDGSPTCPSGEDEAYCKPLEGVIRYIAIREY